MEALLSSATSGKPKPAVAFVGATVQHGLAEAAAALGWMEDPVTIAVGQAGRYWFAELRCVHHAVGQGCLRLPPPMTRTEAPARQAAATSCAT